MIIYKTKNLINGKIYIGYDTNNDSRYLGSGKYFKRAMAKYGKESFKKTTIDFSDDFKELCLKEIFWIDFYDARNSKIGYNLLPGGEGWHGPRSQETCEKMGASHVGKKRKPFSEETKQKMRKPKSEETKLKLQKFSGEKHWNYGKHRSEETKQKIRVGNIGKLLSEETRRKIRAARLGKKFGSYKKKENRNEI